MSFSFILNNKDFCGFTGKVSVLGTRLARHKSPVIRITTQQADSHTVIIIDGHLTTSDLEEVRRARGSARGRIILKLEGLDACAESGIRELRDWLVEGAQLDTATPFLRMVLQGGNTGIKEVIGT